MTRLSDADFIEISVPILLRISGKLPFDVYIKRAENTYTRLFPKDEEIPQQRLKEYGEKKEIKNFFVRKEDYRQYLFYVERVADLFFGNNRAVSAEELNQVVKEMIDLTMIEIVTNMHVDASSVGLAAKTVKGCIDVLAKDPAGMVKIFKQLARHPYAIRHAVLTAVFSILLAKKELMESGKALGAIGLGAMLHDLGMSQLEFNPEDKTELSPKEWREVKEHPQIGAKLLDALKGIVPEVRAIVLQHHEQPNGRGYPNGLRDTEIYLPAKIVSIADSFAALISPRPFREQSFSPLKAIEVMMEDRGKFSPKLLEKFASIFVSIKK